MTEDYINRVKEEYNDNWINIYKERVNNHNLLVREKLDKYKKIRKLLEDKNVREFADLIDFKQGPFKDKLVPLNDPFFEFMLEFIDEYKYDKEDIERDEYPILCYINSTKFIRYEDIYWPLQFPGFAVGASDFIKTGKSRQLFINKHDNIIYPPKGYSFLERGLDIILSNER